MRLNFLKYFTNLGKIFNRNLTNFKMASKNLCFTKYDKNRLKIIDIGANLSGKFLI